MNANTPWSEDDIYLLEAYLRNSSYSMSDIAHLLRRSRSAVVVAARKIIMQQLLRHPVEEVAVHYRRTVKEFRQLLGDTKYYVPLEADVPHHNSMLAPLAMVFGVIVASGIARFGMLLAHSPLLRHEK
jgi:hypothetical protein